MKIHHWFIIFGILALWYVLQRGGEERFVASRAPLDYDQLAVSQGLSADAAALNLQDDLDVSLLPALGRDIIRDAAQQGLREQAFLSYVVQETSNRVREISTIDLNGDDVVDPVLVKPEPAPDEQFVLLSIQVPAPGAYPLPAAGDAAAWGKVETLEVATMSVALSQEALTVQASPNQHLYPAQAGQLYAARDTAPSFMQMYFTMRMLDWMFMPRMYGFWGPGYGYGMYRPTTVPQAASSRAGTIGRRGYGRASAGSTSAIRTAGGAAPTSSYGRLYSRTPPKALRDLRSSAGFQQRQAGRLASGGFGRSGGARALRRGLRRARRLGQRGLWAGRQPRRLRRRRHAFREVDAARTKQQVAAAGPQRFFAAGRRKFPLPAEGQPIDDSPLYAGSSST